MELPACTAHRAGVPGGGAEGTVSLHDKGILSGAVCFQRHDKAAFCRRTYCNPKQIGGILIAKLIVAEKPSVAMSYAKVLGATNRQDGYLEGNGYLVSWCVGHLVELAPPNVYDAKYVKWSIADLPILPQKWQYLVSASTKKQFGILQKLMHRPDVESVICATDAG